MYAKRLILFLAATAQVIGAIDEQSFINAMSRSVSFSDTIKTTLYKLAPSQPIRSMNNQFESSNINRPLFARYPELQKRISCLPLANLPTPIYRLTTIENNFSNNVQLFMKDDGLTINQAEGISFGGNKVRKLEFLLADALSKGAQAVMTYGGIGSNHVVATGACCKRVGLECTALLTPQQVTDVVKRNMKLMKENDIEMILNPNRAIREMQTICSFVQNKYTKGSMHYFIPTGGSNEIGATGYVNAAFELKEQVENGLIPEPDYLYVAMGSCGTVAGLTLGIRAAGLKTKVIGVAVEPEERSHPFATKVRCLVQKTNQLLNQKDATFPLYDWKDSDISVQLDFSGTEYGVPTTESLQAIKLFETAEKIPLDTTYTGKSAAGLLHAISSEAYAQKIVLFWNTFCSQAEDPSIEADQLSPAFHQFFEE